MIDLLKESLSEFSDVDYGEIRYHSRISNQIAIRKGELEVCKSDNFTGVGIRVLIKDGFGFSATNRLDKEAIKRAILEAKASAHALSKNNRFKLQDVVLAKGKFGPKISDPLTNHPLDEKLELVKNTEQKVRKSSPIILSAFVQYNEILDEKYILTTDGACAEIFDSKPEFRIFAVASDGKDYAESYESVGITGGFSDIFKKQSVDELVETCVKRAEKLLKAEIPQGERTTVILDPSLVGLISHEAIGHTVEADFVLSGAITKDKIGTRVGSELVTLFDSGPESGAGGCLYVDDEGVLTQKTIIIENGILKSYLHNRESASLFGVPATGNARAFEYNDEPIIRMRNTGIEPGTKTLDEIIASTKQGYLLKGARGGQADANGEFMFGVQEAYKIEDGKIGKLFRGVTVSGLAFDVLMTVDALSSDFEWQMGSGYCGKWQYAKVDGGGPYLRCQAIIGGRQ